MNKRSKDLRRPLVANDESAEGLQPGVTALNDPSPLVASHPSSILVRRNRVIAARRDHRFDATFHQKGSHLVAVISSIADQALRLAAPTLACLYLDVVQCRLNEFHLRRGSLLQVYSERSPRAIGQYHKLCSLATFSLPDQWTPFLARMNMPSMKHSSQRTFCRSESWFKKARQRFSQTPVSAHCFRRRWTARTCLVARSRERQPIKSRVCLQSICGHHAEADLLFESVFASANAV